MGPPLPEESVGLGYTERSGVVAKTEGAKPAAEEVPDDAAEAPLLLLLSQTEEDPTKFTPGDESFGPPLSKAGSGAVGR